MATHIVKLSDEELRDLIQAMEAAQAELCCGPEATAQWERWDLLIQRLTHGDGADGQSADK